MHCIFLESPDHHRDLHSFPTRRSSDLHPCSESHGYLRSKERSIAVGVGGVPDAARRSEEHTSELQSLTNLVCRLLLEKKRHQQKDVGSYRSEGNRPEPFRYVGCFHPTG